MLCPLHVYDDTYEHTNIRTQVRTHVRLHSCTALLRSALLLYLIQANNCLHKRSCISKSFFLHTHFIYINIASMIQRSMLLPQAFAINTIVRFSLHSHSKSYRIHKWVATCTSSFSQNAFCSPYTQVHLSFRLRFQFQFRFHFYFVTIHVFRLAIFRSHLNWMQSMIKMKWSNERHEQKKCLHAMILPLTLAKPNLYTIFIFLVDLWWLACVRMCFLQYQLLTNETRISRMS